MGKIVFPEMVAIFLPLTEGSKISRSWISHGGKQQGFCSEEVTHVFATSWVAVEEHFKNHLGLLDYYAERIMFLLNDWITLSVESWLQMGTVDYLLDPRQASRPEGALGNGERTPCSPITIEMLEDAQARYVESAKAELQSAKDKKWMVAWRKKVERNLKVERCREFLKEKRANAMYPESEFAFGEPGYETP